MRAIVVTRHGGPEVLELQEQPAPEPGPGQLLVDVEAAGVNYRDIYEREGGGHHGGETPFVAGVEGAGTVAAVGDEVRDVAPATASRGAAARAPTPSRSRSTRERPCRCPTAIATEVAAAALLQGMTAHYLATSTYPVQPGDTVIVHAAAGGVGLLLTQIVKLRGGRVIATTSSEEKAELARGAGADETIGYEGFAERARELTGGEGVAAVYDGIGADTFDEQPRRAAPARLHGPLRRGERAAAAGGDREAQRGLAVPDPADARATTASSAASCSSAPATSSAGSRRGSSTCASARATRSRTPPAPRPTSPRARPPAS